MVCFEPVSVGCCNAIACFSCVFINSIVEINLKALAGSLGDEIICVVLGPNPVDCFNWITCSGCVFGRMIVCAMIEMKV